MLHALLQDPFDELSVSKYMLREQISIMNAGYITTDAERHRIDDKKLSYRRETARQLHMTTWAGQLTF